FAPAISQLPRGIDAHAVANPNRNTAPSAESERYPERSAPVINDRTEKRTRPDDFCNWPAMRDLPRIRPHREMSDRLDPAHPAPPECAKACSCRNRLGL